MLSQHLGRLDNLVKISDQGMSQLHLISEAPNVVTISSGHHHGFSSLLGSTREVAVLCMLHSFTRFKSQNSQSFSDCLSHACLECPPRCGSLDHLMDAVDMINHMPFVDDNMHTPKV
jgi:hypothetical protein